MCLSLWKMLSGVSGGAACGFWHDWPAYAPEGEEDEVHSTGEDYA